MISFGLTNAPTMFIELQNLVFNECLGTFMIMFIEDILIYSKTDLEHEEHLQKVLTTVRENKFVTTRYFTMSYYSKDNVYAKKKLRRCKDEIIYSYNQKFQYKDSNK